LAVDRVAQHEAIAVALIPRTLHVTDPLTGRTQSRHQGFQYDDSSAGRSTAGSTEAADTRWLG
jgi:hypothetical protein